MKPRSLFALALLSAAAFLYSGCKDNASTTRRAVAPPLKNVDVPFSTFTVDAASGDTLDLPTGTRIYIPRGIFADAAGQTISGMVNISFREIHGAADIIASGITMQYDSGGVSHPFQSAGMFEINGSKDGQPVFIKKGESIRMDFASDAAGEQFNYYRLDTTAVNWNFLSTSVSDSNRVRIDLLRSLSAAGIKPAQPSPFDPKAPVIDISLDLDEHPELAGYNGIVWQYTGTGPDPEKNSWIYDQDWSSIRLSLRDTSACTYNLSMKNNTRNFSTVVRPALKGNNYTAALEKFKARMSAFEAAEAERKKKEAQAQAMPAFQRSTSVSSFGIYNYDCIYHQKDAVMVAADFKFQDEDFNEFRDKVTIYLISGKEKTVIAYSALYTGNFCYLHSVPNRIIAVLNGTNKTEMLSVNGFAKAVSGNSKSANFPLKSSDKSVASIDDLRKLVESL